MARIGISLDTEQMRRFEALAALENKRPATLAAQIILGYMQGRSKEIEPILRARAAYDDSVAKVRAEDAAKE